MNKAIVTALSSVVTAQGLKIPFEYATTGKWNLKSAFIPGGMPSSHSAGVTSLATYVGLSKGFRSPEFAISTMLGLIVMYDAAGVRFHAGETAMVVNDLENRMEQVYESHPEYGEIKKRKELEERLGHLPSEVVAGAFLGMALGALGYLFSKR
ncbi:MAG TPA: divergent PAP2 family protein [Bacillota bacterium]|nr:divergent PAP2 family protein [Bacillota bacterium]